MDISIRTEIAAVVARIVKTIDTGSVFQNPNLWRGHTKVRVYVGGGHIAITENGLIDISSIKSAQMTEIRAWMRDNLANVDHFVFKIPERILMDEEKEALKDCDAIYRIKNPVDVLKDESEKFIGALWKASSKMEYALAISPEDCPLPDGDSMSDNVRFFNHLIDNLMGTTNIQQAMIKKMEVELVRMKERYIFGIQATIRDHKEFRLERECEYCDTDTDNETERVKATLRITHDTMYLSADYLLNEELEIQLFGMTIADIRTRLSFVMGNEMVLDVDLVL